MMPHMETAKRSQRGKLLRQMREGKAESETIRWRDHRDTCT